MLIALWLAFSESTAAAREPRRGSRMVTARSWRAPESGPSNPLKVGFRVAERELLKAFRACLREAGFPQLPARATRAAGRCGPSAQASPGSTARPSTGRFSPGCAGTFLRANIC